MAESVLCPEANTSMRGLTTEEVARRYRVSPDKVRGWIRRGELAAVNTARVRCGKPRHVVTPEALIAFEKSFASQTDTPRPERRRRRQKGYIDYLADVE